MTGEFQLPEKIIKGNQMHRNGSITPLYSYKENDYSESKTLFEMDLLMEFTSN